MARVKPKMVPGGNFQTHWETVLKPQVLQYYSPPIELVAEVMGISVSKVQEQLRSGLYDYGVARPCVGGSYKYEFHSSLKFIAHIEGKI